MRTEVTGICWIEMDSPRGFRGFNCLPNCKCCKLLEPKKKNDECADVGHKGGRQCVVRRVVFRLDMRRMS